MWIYNPHSGGRTIPETIKAQVRQRILDHAEKHYQGRYNRIDVRVRGKFCYIDAYRKPYVPNDYDRELFGESREEHIERLRTTPTHLCRQRYSGDDDRWPMAFYTYIQEKYEPCVFDNGIWEGAPEAASDTAAVYLTP
jgi:hypothetical protein